MLESDNKVYTIFVVEDDLALAEILKKILEKWNFEVILCNDFESVISQFTAVNPHIVLLDVNIPAYDGFYWCRKMREISNVPILFISSRDSNMDIIMAISTGADDYIPKPFDSNVLVAKLQAIIRRTYEYQLVDKPVLECNNIILSLNDMAIQYKEQSLELTKNEFKIMKMLMENRGKIVSRDKIMLELWDDDLYVNENTLTVNMNRLRKRLKDIGVVDFIETKKGTGYMIP